MCKRYEENLNKVEETWSRRLVPCNQPQDIDVQLKHLFLTLDQSTFIALSTREDKRELWESFVIRPQPEACEVQATGSPQGPE